MPLPTPPDVVALAGPNGAGKSTIGPLLLRQTLGISTFVNADVIAAGRAYVRRLTELLAAGYRFHMVFLWLESADLAVARVEERVRSGGHSVPEDVIRRRYRAGIDNFLRLYRPLATSWRLYDNSAGPPPRMIAAGRETGRLEVLDEPTWSRIEGRSDHEP